MSDRFKIKTEIDGQIVKADCQVRLGRFLFLTMTEPYNEIKTKVVVLDEERNIRQFSDSQEAREKAIEELWNIMEQINFVKQYRSEYTEASNYFQKRYSQLITEFRASEKSRQRGCLARQSEITHQVFGEYVEMVNKLIPFKSLSYLVSPDLLVQILSVI